MLDLPQINDLHRCVYSYDIQCTEAESASLRPAQVWLERCDCKFSVTPHIDSRHAYVQGVVGLAALCVILIPLFLHKKNH